MANEKQVREEWKVTIPEGSTAQMELKPSWKCRMRSKLKQADGRIRSSLLTLLQTISLNISMLVKKIGKVAEDDPRKVIHGVKVSIALTLASLFYYARPLYDCVGGSSIWAVMTVVMVFELTVGGCLYKGFNRAMATLCAAALAVGIHWIATKSGETFRPIILSASLFLFASAATYSRFIPAVKARFEYGVIIFILTFSLVAVSGYRVDELLQLAEQRLSTVAIGVCICVLVCVLIHPVWSGEELHLLVSGNLEKLADFLQGYVQEHFTIKEGTAGGSDSFPNRKLEGYKSVLNAQALENSHASLARWEPPHGRFRFRHPWKQYLKIGAAMRHCACCMEALDGYLTHFEAIQVPGYMDKDLVNACMRLSSDSAMVLRKLSSSLKSMKRSPSVDLLIEEMKNTAREVKTAARSFANQVIVPSKIPIQIQGTEAKQQSVLSESSTTMPLMEAMPAITVASLLIEISERIDSIIDAANTLAELARFETTNLKGKPPSSSSSAR